MFMYPLPLPNTDTESSSILLTCFITNKSGRGSSGRTELHGLHVTIRPYHGVLRPIILREMECIDAFCSIQLVNIIPRET
jgi:hypothetical protein